MAENSSLANTTSFASNDIIALPSENVNKSENDTKSFSIVENKNIENLKESDVRENIEKCEIVYEKEKGISQVGGGSVLPLHLNDTPFSNSTISQGNNGVNDNSV